MTRRLANTFSVNDLTEFVLQFHVQRNCVGGRGLANRVSALSQKVKANWRYFSALYETLALPQMYKVG
jgi:hypothetical protein